MFLIRGLVSARTWLAFIHHVVGLVVAIAGLTLPILTRVFVDDVLLGGGQSALGVLVAALGIATVLTLLVVPTFYEILDGARASFLRAIKSSGD